jgi:hypothetical protein
VSKPLYGFRKSLDVRLLPNGKWQLLEELRYLSSLTNKAYTIEAGYCTDFASVPRLPIAYWLAGNTAHLASVVHDYLYENGIEPRYIADKIFAEIMDATPDFPTWRKDLMWMAVRVFGASHYHDPEGNPRAGFEITKERD